MYSFLHCVLQIYLEFWKLTQPPSEYIPDLMYQTMSQPLEQQKAAISEITSLLKHIECYQFFPHVNNLHCNKKLEKTECRPHFTSTRLLQPNHLEIILRIPMNELLV